MIQKTLQLIQFLISGKGKIEGLLGLKNHLGAIRVMSRASSRMTAPCSLYFFFIHIFLLFPHTCYSADNHRPPRLYDRQTFIASLSFQPPEGPRFKPPAAQSLRPLSTPSPSAIRPSFVVTAKSCQPPEACRNRVRT